MQWIPLCRVKECMSRTACFDRIAAFKETMGMSIANKHEHQLHTQSSPLLGVKGTLLILLFLQEELNHLDSCQNSASAAVI